MISTRKLEANSRNAKKSTGPRTANGKAASSRNALKHGLLSRDVVLPDEDPVAFEELQDRLRATLSPCGAVEELLFERIAGSAWRLRRAVRIEQALFRWQHLSELAHRAEATVRSVKRREQEAHVASGSTEAPVGREYKAATAKVDEVRERQGAESLVIVDSWMRLVDGEALRVLGRYEGGLERSFYRALGELRQIQATRQQPRSNCKGDRRET